MTEKNENNFIVLIDDDELIHYAWRKEASKKGLALHSFDSIDAFMAKKDQFPLETTIYIDSDLGNGKRGEKESIKLHQAGFKHLILATGYSKVDVDLTGIHWITDVVGKRPQFN